MEINDYHMAHLLGLEIAETFDSEPLAVMCLPMLLARHKSSWAFVRQNRQADEEWQVWVKKCK